jgi:hypothetical protein
VIGREPSGPRGYDSDFQQIQGGQQIGILDGTPLGRRNSWLTGAVAGFYFILNELNLLASPNLLENNVCARSGRGAKQKPTLDGRNAPVAPPGSGVVVGNPFSVPLTLTC